MVTKSGQPGTQRSARGFTLFEVVLSVAIVAVVFGGIINAYTATTRRAEWTGYSLAAQTLAIQYIEMARSARWDTAANVDEVTNFVRCVSGALATNGYSVTPNGTTSVTYTGFTNRVLDLPTVGTITNFTTITVTATRYLNMVGAGSPNFQMYCVQVDAAWPYIWRSATNYYTNTLVTYMAPDNRETL